MLGIDCKHWDLVIISGGRGRGRSVNSDTVSILHLGDEALVPALDIYGRIILGLHSPVVVGLPLLFFSFFFSFFFFSFFWFLISFVMNETAGISEFMLHEKEVAKLNICSMCLS